MTKIDTPLHLQDTNQSLSENGFSIGPHWYHGTTSSLVESITQNGLKGSGDAAFNETTTKAMAAIGADYTEHKEPVFLTQSKTLAYYWAQQKTELRNQRFEGNETPVVLAITLPEPLNAKVRSDVGAATMLIAETHPYMEYLDELYAAEQLSLTALELDPATSDRMAYLNLMGMAYTNDDIDSQYITVLTE